MAEQELDRNETATPYKLEQARKKGMVAKSADLAYVGILAGVSLFVYSSGWKTIIELAKVEQAVLYDVKIIEWSVESLLDWLEEIAVAAVSPLLPFIMVIVVAAVLSSFIQTGPIFSFKPIQPDFNRLNPAAGLKKLFSLKMLYEGAKSLLKLLIVGFVLVVSLLEISKRLAMLSTVDSKLLPKILLTEGGSLLVKLILTMLVLAMLDVIYVRWEFTRQMRMSKREIKEEYKQREGDPRIRARLKEIRLELLRRTKSLSGVPEADVLITNPTHYAIAIKYAHGSMPAPMVVAKGAGELAVKMRELAVRHHVAIVQNPPLARTLFRQVESSNYVPESLYPQIAKILIWVFAARTARQQRRAES
ncbi:flagellar biosynthetic protein FlhB [Chitinivorax tropicus]|uniref:Flagellar biosynthetic protein FlhB n=1 Tax=Chitinivorax tropicus TaxID=714531 RepID=A0A840MSZ5_9PROT|nr:EscU/YscU/HrcU family type III secretion system export apparatus switch protein [Chitinivorax tropicus]MBB5020317.1 flagellar biosynthetic protein FlhB [Chitinivorax tropicus]